MSVNIDGEEKVLEDLNLTNEEEKEQNEYVDSEIAKTESDIKKAEKAIIGEENLEEQMESGNERDKTDQEMEEVLRSDNEIINNPILDQPNNTLAVAQRPIIVINTKSDNPHSKTQQTPQHFENNEASINVR